MTRYRSGQKRALEALDVATEWCKGNKFTASDAGTSVYIVYNAHPENETGPLSDLTQLRVWFDHNRINWSGPNGPGNGTYWYEGLDTMSKSSVQLLMWAVLDKVPDGDWEKVLTEYGFEFVPYNERRWSDDLGGFERIKV